MTPPTWSTACPDWRERIVARESLVPCPPLFPDRSDDALAVFKSLQVIDLPRKADGTWPTLGESCESFAFDLVAAIFGAEDPATARRLIREFMLLISKKNIKSTLAAGIMVTALVVNWRYEAEFLILAPTIEVANNSFGPAAGFVRADPNLGQVLKVIEHKRQIVHLATRAVLKVVAADSDTVSGNKASGVLVEELWLFGKKPKSEAMLVEALGGQASRPEAFVLFITTFSDEPPAGVFKSRLAYFRDVRDGVIDDPASLGMLYEWPEDLIEAEAYLDPAMFYVTNPMLGRSVSADWLQSKLEQAQAGEGEGLQVFLAKHLNVEIGMRLRRDRWDVADIWMDGADTSITLDSLIARCEVAIVGIDSGGRGDLYGLSVVGRERGGDSWLAWSHAWAHEYALTKHKQTASLLRGFAADGDLTITESNQEIVEQVAEIAARVRKAGLMPEHYGVAVDHYGMGVLTDALVKAGFDPGDDDLKRAGHIALIRQRGGLSSAINAIGFKLGDGMFMHDGSPLMAWCVSNALVKYSGAYLFVDKETSGAGKIDPLVAMLNAVKVMENGPVAAGRAESPYATRGLITV